LLIRPIAVLTERNRAEWNRHPNRTRFCRVPVGSDVSDYGRNGKQMKNFNPLPNRPLLFKTLIIDRPRTPPAETLRRDVIIYYYRGRGRRSLQRRRARLCYERLRSAGYATRVTAVGGGGGVFPGTPGKRAACQPRRSVSIPPLPRGRPERYATDGTHGNARTCTVVVVVVVVAAPVDIIVIFSFRRRDFIFKPDVCYRLYRVASRPAAWKTPTPSPPAPVTLSRFARARRIIQCSSSCATMVLITTE